MKSKLSYNTLKTKRESENIDTIFLTKHDAYVWYRERSEFCNREDVKDFIDYGKILREYYKIMTEMLLESKNGAFIQDFGYIGFLKYQGNHKKYRQFEKDKPAKLLTVEDVYYTSFIPIMRNRKCRMYSMDSSYSKSFRTDLIEKLKQGYNYMFSASLFFLKAKKKYNKFDNFNR
jgi:hypothetical protein